MAEIASPADQKLLALADRLVGSAGRGRATALGRLDGGKNNQVYRVETDAGDTVVLKSYFSDPRDPRDRLAAEWGFLRHTWSRGVRVVPEPLASDETARAGLYGEGTHDLSRRRERHARLQVGGRQTLPE